MSSEMPRVVLTFCLKNAKLSQKEDKVIATNDDYDYDDADDWGHSDDDDHRHDDNDVDGDKQLASLASNAMQHVVGALFIASVVVVIGGGWWWWWW